MKPKVTVLMSVYNGKHYLREAVASILNQTFQDFEFLIIDDGSQDGSREILEEFAEQDPRIRLLVNERNRGLGYSLRRGVAEARGEWIARMDCDDVAYPERLERQLHWLDSHPNVDILGTRAVDIDDAGEVVRQRLVPLTHSEIRRTLPFADPMVHPSVVFRRRAILDVGSYRAELPYVQDYDLWFRCMAGGLRFANLPNVLLHYRVSEGYRRKKLSWKYRKTDFRVRLEGCRRLRCKGLEWFGVLVPLILGLTPTVLTDWMYHLAKWLDPRQRSR